MELSNWEIVNDDVMGGLSSSSVRRTDDGTWLFSGEVSLENNGGFASARAKKTETLDLSGCSRVTLRVRGDGRRYGFNLRSAGMVRLSYRAYFETEGAWQTVEIPISALQPISFGDVVPDAPPLDLSQVSMVGFIIADGQPGAFSLEIDRVQCS